MVIRQNLHQEVQLQRLRLEWRDRESEWSADLSSSYHIFTSGYLRPLGLHASQTLGAVDNRVFRNHFTRVHLTTRADDAAAGQNHVPPDFSWTQTQTSSAALSVFLHDFHRRFSHLWIRWRCCPRFSRPETLKKQTQVRFSWQKLEAEATVWWNEDIPHPTSKTLLIPMLMVLGSTSSASGRMFSGKLISHAWWEKKQTLRICSLKIKHPNP